MKKKLMCVIGILLITALSVIIYNPKEVKYTVKKLTANLYADPIETTYINKIEINYDPYIARLSPAYTYNEVREIFEDNVTIPNTDLYYNDNVYFWYCTTDEECTLSEVTGGYDETIKKDRYTYVSYQVEMSDCRGYDEICEYDFYHEDEDLATVEVWVNGVKRDDAIVNNFNEYWHSVFVYVPTPTDDSSFVKKITVTSAADNIEKGTSANFTANISYYGEGYDTYEWSIIGANNANTQIDSEGHLTVSADETAESIIVRASSDKDIGKYGQKEINIIDEPLSIDSVNVTPKDQTVVYGGGYKFYADVYGTANKDVIWTITGANNLGTTIDGNGYLTVAEDETATSITITATSVFDNTKYDSVTVITRNTEYITKVELFYDENEVAFSSRLTYDEIRHKLSEIVAVPKNANYDTFGGVYMRYCPTSERCTSGYEYGYNIPAALDKYTYIEFDVHANPYGNNVSNPEYDFYDSDVDLANVEVWVNGVRREDALVKNHNEAWRTVDILIPVTITDSKLVQELYFAYERYSVNYEDEPFKNRIYHEDGDGEVTYASSNEEVATVDEEGYVTVRKIGTCTITATAAATEQYNEKTATYEVVVNPKYIDIVISGYESNYDYTGSSIRPEVTITSEDAKDPLVKDVDYEVIYAENINNNGGGTITIRSLAGSNYEFYQRNAYFSINRIAITEEDITLTPSTVEYDGTQKHVTETIIINGRTLVKDVDYQLEEGTNTEIGTAYIYITGIGNYSGYATKTFEITEPSIPSLKGDLNRNERIDLQDIISLLRKYLNLEETTPLDIEIADMNDDKKISIQDIILLLKTYLGIS